MCRNIEITKSLSYGEELEEGDRVVVCHNIPDLNIGDELNYKQNRYNYNMKVFRMPKDKENIVCVITDKYRSSIYNNLINIFN